MSLKHFAEGAGESAHVLNFLGYSDKVRYEPAESQVRHADFTPQENPKESTGASQLIVGDPEVGRNRIRDFVGEAIFHKAMDGIPGIEKVRKYHSPENITFESLPSYGLGGYVKPLSKEFVGAKMVFNSDRENTSYGTAAHETAHQLLIPLEESRILEDPSHPEIVHQWPHARLHVHLTRALLGNDHANQLKTFYEKNGIDFGSSKV
jgi:hypothetical protein